MGRRGAGGDEAAFSLPSWSYPSYPRNYIAPSRNRQVCAAAGGGTDCSGSGATVANRSAAACNCRRHSARQSERTSNQSMRDLLCRQVWGVAAVRRACMLPLLAANLHSCLPVDQFAQLCSGPAGHLAGSAA